MAQKDSYIKVLQLLDQAHEAGIPRGAHEIEAEIMQFALGCENITPEEALAFSCRLSDAIANTKMASLTAQLLDMQSKLKGAVAFIKAHGLLDEYNNADPNAKPRRSKKTEQASAPETGEDTGAQAKQDAPEEVGEATPTPATETVAPAAPPAVETAEKDAEKPAVQPDAATPGTTDSVMDYLLGEGKSAGKVDGIFSSQHSAEDFRKSTKREGLKVFPLDTETYRISDSGPTKVGLTGKSFIVAAALPDAEYAVAGHRYVALPDWKCPGTEEAF